MLTIFDFLLFIICLVFGLFSLMFLITFRRDPTLVALSLVGGGFAGVLMAFTGTGFMSGLELMDFVIYGSVIVVALFIFVDGVEA